MIEEVYEGEKKWEASFTLLHKHGESWVGSLMPDKVFPINRWCKVIEETKKVVFIVWRCTKLLEL